MSRSCQSGTFSRPTSAAARTTRARPRDPLGDLRVALVRHRRRALHARSRTAPRPRAPRCAPGGGSRSRSGRATSRTSASVESSSAWRSRAITWVETGSGSSPSRSHAMRSTSGSTAAYVPTVPESWPTRFASSARASARRGRGRARTPSRRASSRRSSARRGCRASGRCRSCAGAPRARRDDRVERAVEPGEDQRARLADLQRRARCRRRPRR